MADTSKCYGESCSKRETCWRFLAPNSQWQSYISPDPKDCDMYLETKTKELATIRVNRINET